MGLTLKTRITALISLPVLVFLTIGLLLGNGLPVRWQLPIFILLGLVAMGCTRILANRLVAPLNKFPGIFTRHLAGEQESQAGLEAELRDFAELADPLSTLIHDSRMRRQALQDQLAFLQNLIDTIPSPVFYKDAAFRYLGCNRRFEEYIGYKREELVGKTTFDIAPPELARIYQQADEELWSQGGQQVYETSVKFADGSLHDVIFFKKVFHNAAGEPTGMLGLFHDITERKHSELLRERALAVAQAAEEKVSNILHSVADGLIVTNHRNRIVHINAVAAEMAGIDAAAAVDKPFTHLFQDDEMRQQARTFFALPDAEKRLHEFHYRHKITGGRRIVQAHAATMRTATGRLSGRVTLLRDVTRERELDRIKSEFISTAAHELRTPLSVILGYSELLLHPEIMGVAFTAEEQQQSIREIYRKGEALARIVDDLFDISRMEAGLPLPLEMAPCDLNKIVREVVDRYAKQSPRHRFELELDATCHLVADDNRLSQVLENLVSNAVKYSPTGGCIRVSSVCSTQSAVVTVEDQGIGMTEEQVARIFDKFFRADSSNTAIGGLGVGMSIVKMIIEGHGGEVKVASSVGQGTRIDVTLPVDRPPVVD